MADPTLADALRDDAAARLAALEIESCIVEAPAGAGKTELLTQRFLRLLATVDSPEEVMAITFTNKAAAEMQKRILDNLHAAANREIPEAPHKRLTYRLAGEVLATAERKDWHLLEQPGRLRLTTIDALCAALARQMPLLSRFGASPTVTDDAGPLYQDAARRTLELLEAERAEYAEPVAAALAYLDNDSGRLNHLLSAMLARRDQWLSAVSSEHASAAFDDALAQLVTAELAAIRRALDPAWEKRLMPAVRFAVETLLVNGKADSPIVALRDWDQPLAAHIDELPRWRGLVEFLFTGKNEWRKSFTVAVGIPAGKEGKAWKDGLAEILAAAPPRLDRMLARVRLLPGLAGREAEDEIVGHFATLLKLATANLWQVFREQGETDFVEVAQRALDALGASDEDGFGGGPSDLALRLDYRIRHLLVDEFQDTSPTQIKLLERLTAGWSPDDGRTLFCVGDPMQSIYRFRKADVGLFLRAAGEGIGGLPLKRLRLARNNRSGG
ncbi:MAG TPA: UvrD-helicase domain-containing protein, partial [Rhodocyclaceae bacterium]|nr:UvrD-helicase domain-containing protein [Rhodocyclaceae bacterium]